MVDQVPINSPYETFSAVAKELFCDGIYNWGRIVILFYFTYKLILKVRRKQNFFLQWSYSHCSSHFKINQHRFFMFLSNGRCVLLEKLSHHGSFEKAVGFVYLSSLDFFMSSLILVGHLTRCSPSITSDHYRCFLQWHGSYFHGSLSPSTNLISHRSWITQIHQERNSRPMALFLYHLFMLVFFYNPNRWIGINFFVFYFHSERHRSIRIYWFFNPLRDVNYCNK